MCTSIAMRGKKFYFGRNMDIEYSFGEKIVFVPRQFRFSYHRALPKETRYALVGTASVAEGMPLFADAMNEKGLCGAGLNFPNNAYYFDCPSDNQINLAPYELISWVLEQASCVDEAEHLLANIRLVAEPFRQGYPVPTLHWMFSDAKRSIVVEPTKNGLCVYRNPFDVLTNNPSFPYHAERMNDFLNLTSEYPQNRAAKDLNLQPCGQGMGAIGLPGDASPSSRFVRAVFHLKNTNPKNCSVSQFFHVLDSVQMVRGSVKTQNGAEDYTTYACCMDATDRVYYAIRYGNRRISAVKMQSELLDSDKLKEFAFDDEEDVLFRN